MTKPSNRTYIYTDVNKRYDPDGIAVKPNVPVRESEDPETIAAYIKKLQKELSEIQAIFNTMLENNPLKEKDKSELEIVKPDDHSQGVGDILKARKQQRRG